MKLYGCILIFLSCTLMGFFKWYCLKKRCSNLMEIKNVTERLKHQIAFLKNDLATAFNNAASGHSVFLLYKDCSKNIVSLGVDKAWSKSLDIHGESLFFTKEDIKVLKKFSRGLGMTDTQAQLQTLNLIVSQTEELYHDALCQYNSKGNLYKTAGSAVGIFLVLLLI